MQASRGFRSTSLSDRYFRGPSGRGFVVGNPDLEPEHSRQLDLAVRWSGAGRSLGLFGYDYRILDLIERFRAGTDFRFRNRGEAQIRGLELEAQQELPRGFSLQLGAAWARGEDATSGAAIDDIAALNGAATVRWASVKGFAYLRLSAFARDERPGPNEVVRPGYALVDLGASWRFHPLLELRVLVRNLGDRRYHGLADAAADLSAGRSVMIGLTGRH